MVIEKKSLLSDKKETVRIPLREERINVNKYALDLEEINIYKHNNNQTEIINEVIRKEVMYLNTIGVPIVEVKKQ
jgi:uncharacterized protein (TIGR02271 family)